MHHIHDVRHTQKVVKTQKAIFLSFWACKDGFECIFGMYVFGQVVYMTDVAYMKEYLNHSFIQSKNAFKTVLACSEAKINGFLCFDRSCIRPIFGSFGSNENIDYFWQGFWTLFLVRFSGSFGNSFAKFLTIKTPVYFWVSFWHRNSGKVDFPESRNAKNFRQTHGLSV